MTVPRLLAGVHPDGSPETLADHVRRLGELPRPGANGNGLIPLLDSSGLLGRGGASFPTGRKLAAVASRRGPRIVVANGCEGEPASGKDKALARLAPQLVLDGVSLAADAVGADEAVVVLSASARHELEVVSGAMSERRRARLDRVTLRLAAIADGFVTGEETALVNWLDGGEPKPTFVPPRPFERGVRGRPTLVQNVETLANVALIARHGARWFRGAGTDAEPGTVLASILGAVGRPGVYELELGTPLAQAVADAGGPTEPLRAVLVGGYFGAWVSAREAESLVLSDESLRAASATLGARVIAALPARSCGVLETARIARYLAAESAGQCGPCVHGLRSVTRALDGLARREPGNLPKLTRWLAQVRGRGACAHPDGAVRFVSSALRVFADEFARHEDGRCSGSIPPVLPPGRPRPARHR
jgi:NADH:ubiquinone oxidoreductase subunit F (NADH-binding)